MRLAVFIVLVLSSVACGAATLPLDGYYRVGRYMPVGVSGRTEFAGRGMLTTRIESPRDAEVVIPVLILADDVDLAPFPRPLRAVGADERLVGLIGVDAKSVDWLFPGKTIVPIQLDATQPLRGPAVAWEALDAVVCDGPIPVSSLDEVGTLLGAGVAFVTRDRWPLHPELPWVHRGDWWVLRHGLAGPVGAISNSAYTPVASWTPGMSARTRAFMVAIGVIVSVLTVAATLLRGRVVVVVAAIAAITTLAMAAIGLWARQLPFAEQAGGSVVTIAGRLTQTDRWSYHTAAAAAHVSLDVSGGGCPIFSSDEQAKLQSVSMICGSQGWPVRITARLGPGQKLACLSRWVGPTNSALRSTIHVGETDSPLHALVRSAYLGAGIRTLGQVPSDDGQTWPSVVLERAE